jgi:PAS domain S-box-containing protein
VTEQPHTALEERITALGADVQAAARRLDALTLPSPAKESELGETAAELRDAAAALSQAHAELNAAVGALREQLEQERVRYRDLFEWAPEAYLVTDPEGVILEANRAAEELFGYAAGALREAPMERLLPASERQAFSAMLSRMRMLEVVGDWELELCRRDKSGFPAAVTVAWMRNLRGRMGTLRWLIRDVTERKSAEKQIVSANIELDRRVRERTEELETVGREKDEALARLEAVVDQLPAAIVIADAESRRVVAANEQAARLVRQVAGDVNTLDTWLTLGFHPDGRPFQADDRPLMRALTVGEAVAAHEIEFNRLDGRSVLYETSAVPVRNPDGEVVGAVAAYWDLTERARLARAEREFVTNAAHELRTPLAALASAVEVLQSGAKDDPDQRERFLTHVEQQSERLQRLVRSLLLLARVQTLHEKPEREPIPVRTLLESIAQVGPPDRVRIEHRCPPGTRVLANRELAEQALLNLVSNAAKYAPDGEIVLSGQTDNGLVALEVADSGPGMTGEQARRAAERFYRGNDEDVEGFGLGLSIAQQAAQALDGELRLESDGQGTRARLLLPLAGDDG